jgi:hypothetical protein
MIQARDKTRYWNDGGVERDRRSVVYVELCPRIERSASGEVALWCARVLAKVPGTRAATYVLFTSFADTNSRIAKAAPSRMKRTTTWDIHPPSTSISWKQNPA